MEDISGKLDEIITSKAWPLRQRGVRMHPDGALTRDMREDITMQERIVQFVHDDLISRPVTPELHARFSKARFDLSPACRALIAWMEKCPV